MPLNHQLAFGSNLQVCINPLGLAAGVPGWSGAGFAATNATTGLLGSGIGGNMQYTIGTSASFVLGRSIDFSLGSKLEFHKSDLPTSICCGLIGAMNIIFFAAYGIEDDDTKRANWTIGFQVAMDILLMLAMQMVIANKEADDLAKKANAPAAGCTCSAVAPDPDPKAMAELVEGFGNMAALAAVGILPPVLIGNNEHFYH
jgi:hypothetical protein